MTARRYAEDTDVPEERSRGQIEHLLRQHGAVNVIVSSLDEPALLLVQFTLDGLLIRMSQPGDVSAQERRRRWRVLLLWCKARLEAVADGSSVLEQFTAWIALPDGATVGRWLAPQIDQIYSAGRMPLALPAGRHER